MHTQTSKRKSKNSRLRSENKGTKKKKKAREKEILQIQTSASSLEKKRGCHHTLQINRASGPQNRPQEREFKAVPAHAVSISAISKRLVVQSRV